MTRPVDPDEATALPGPRVGVTVRPVDRHDDGLPVAQDLQDVHRVLEDSSRTASAPTARASPSSSCACARILGTAGTTGGSRQSRPTRAPCPPERSSPPCCGPRRRGRGQLRRLHRRPPSSPRTRCREVVAAHGDHGCRAPWPEPRGTRGRRRLTDGGRRPLHVDGLGHGLPHPVLAPRPGGLRPRYRGVARRHDAGETRPTAAASGQPL